MNTIDLPIAPDARFFFDFGGERYFIERSDAPGAIELPMRAHRAGAQKVQSMGEACRVARVTHAAPDGRPIMWTWLSASYATHVIRSLTL